MNITLITLALPCLSLGIWFWLLGLRGQFWQADQRLEPQDEKLTELQVYPSVAVVIPARNEADLLPVTLRSLLTQDYPGSLTITLIDDQSTDGTGTIAAQTAEELGQRSQVHVLSGKPLPAGWTGKLWAMEQGVQFTQSFTPKYILFTDADIAHDELNLSRLVAKAEQENLDLVSAMVQLRCVSNWEKLLIPAFVFFFQKLYPFRWVNQPDNAIAAAAGGCILIRHSALMRVGGISILRSALIDDCTLAQAVKIPQKKSPKEEQTSYLEGKIWLGLSSLTHSLRSYPDLQTIWQMVSRTAYTQLNYSPLLLLGTLLGMTIIYLVPPVGAIAGLLTANWLVAIISLSAWLLMAWAYFPTLKLYKCSAWLAFALPAIAFLYTLMTLDSAIQHWRGQGGAWKGRVYS